MIFDEMLWFWLWFGWEMSGSDEVLAVVCVSEMTSLCKRENGLFSRWSTARRWAC